MVLQKLRRFKHDVIDIVDLEGSIAKQSFRTALACFFCIILFELLQNRLLSSWAGFAAFAFVQNDLQEGFASRFKILVAIIILFTLIVFIGMILSNHIIIFLISIPIVVFLVSYLSCLGTNYFNAGGWTLFLYILSGSSPTTLHNAFKISEVFLVCGVVSLAVCFFIFPLNPRKQIFLSFERLLSKFSMELQLRNQSTQESKPRNYLDSILMLQEKNMTFLLTTFKLNCEQKERLIKINKLLYKISFLIKSSHYFYEKIKIYPSFPSFHMKEYHGSIEVFFEDVILQIKNKSSLDLSIKKENIFLFREPLMNIRKKELLNLDSDFSEYLNYSHYFYHFVKIFELLELLSQTINQLHESEL